MKVFFDFLKYCLGNKVVDADFVAKMDWPLLFDFAQKQALVGFCFDGVERVGKEDPEELKRNPVGEDLLMTWMGKVQVIRRKNKKVNAVAAKLYAQLRRDGLRCCILKGQGNALMYSNPYSRTPGDIDVWVNAPRKDIMSYGKSHFALGDDIRYQHLETVVDGVPVELHFTPVVMNCPLYHVRLQKWLRRNADLQCSNIVSLPDGAGEIAVPTSAFNVIYQLCHLYHHFFDEGIGMRQIIDYYLVVCDNSSNPSVSLSKGSSTFSPSPYPLRFPRARGTETSGSGDVTAPPRRSEPLRSKVGGPSEVSPNCAGWDCLSIEGDCSAVLQGELKHLGLWKFAGAVMYVLHEVLGLPEEKMICPMDERRGRLLLSEIMNGGNFGKHFTKYGHFTQQGMARKYFLKIWRNMHFVRYYPAEALSEPVFRTWHFFWRIWRKVKS